MALKGWIWRFWEVDPYGNEYVLYFGRDPDLATVLRLGSREDPGTPVIFLCDTHGQRLLRRAGISLRPGKGPVRIEVTVKRVKK